MLAQGDFDAEAVHRLQGLGGDALVARVAGLFVSFGGERVREAEQAGAAGDLGQVARSAHALRSSAANIGATGLLAVATELELAARAGRADIVPPLLERLRDAYASSLPHVTTLIPGAAA